MAMGEGEQVAMNRAGQIRIPRAIRARLGLSAGTRFVVETLDDGEIRLRPVEETTQLVDKEGVLVVQSVAAGELEGIEKRAREERLDNLNWRRATGDAEREGLSPGCFFLGGKDY